jgi:hypothetical protein
MSNTNGDNNFGLQLARSFSLWGIINKIIYTPVWRSWDYIHGGIVCKIVTIISAIIFMYIAAIVYYIGTIILPFIYVLGCIVAMSKINQLHHTYFHNPLTIKIDPILEG